jgi:uncharacterized phage protein (TIGR02220 family)
MQKRDFKGVWIPKEIWLSTDLKVMEKLILVEIDSLDNEDGCFASNEHFSKFFSLSKNRCSEIIKSLEKKGYIKIDYIYQEGSKAISRRVIRCVRNIDGGIRNIDNPIRKTEEGYSENREDNNTSFNNTFSNTSNKKDIVEQSSTTPLPYEEIVQYLNQKTNKNFKHTSKVTQRHIRARLAEGFTVSDFKQVIDNKCNDWLRDQKMKEYLRPETLFGTKFESYLNSKTTTTKQTGPYIDSCGLRVL